MTKSILNAITIAVAMSFGNAASGQAVEEFQLISDISSHNADLHARMAALETSWAEYKVTDANVGCGAQIAGCRSGRCESACDCGGCWCSPCSGMIASAELLMFKMHNSDGADNNTGEEWQDAFYTGSRFTLGYMNDCGRTLRARYFEFATVEDSPGAESIHIETLDLEYAGRFTVGCGWYGEFSGGIRWASWEETSDFRYTSTIGPVVGVEIRTDMTSCLSLYGNVRQSYQFGTGFEGTGRGRGTYGISEIELGAELQRSMAGQLFFLRSGFATQYYTGLLDDSDEDMGLVGFTIAAGLTR